MSKFSNSAVAMIRNRFKVKEYYKNNNNFESGQIRSTTIAIANDKYPQDMWVPVSFLLLEKRIDMNGNIWGGMLVMPEHLSDEIHGINLKDEDFKINTFHESSLRSVIWYYGWFYMSEKFMGRILGEVESPQAFISGGLAYALNGKSYKKEDLPMYEFLKDIKKYQYK